LRLLAGKVLSGELAVILLVSLPQLMKSKGRAMRIYDRENNAMNVVYTIDYKCIVNNYGALNYF
jgi:conjugal transfer/entry exclusion protein